MMTNSMKSTAMPGFWIAILGVLLSTGALAATVNVVPSNAHPKVGETFSVTLNCVDFPETYGTTLRVTFNPAVVSVSAVELTPGSPFTGALAFTLPIHPGDAISVLGPDTGALPTGSFGAFRISFTALAPGDPAITLVDDHRNITWSDPTGQPIQADYRQAHVKVKAAAGRPRHH